MKKLFITIALPLALISYLVITKWWYAEVFDGVNEFLYGFPFVSSCEGTISLSHQYFVLEMILNFLVRLVFWTIVVLAFEKYLTRLRIPAMLVKVFYGTTIAFVLFFAFASNRTDDVYKLKRDFDIDVYDSGLIFVWQNPPMRELFENEIRSQLETLFEDPSVMDNSEENNLFINNFQDSGAYNDDNQKTGLWIEYKVEDAFNEVPLTFISTSGDSNQVSITNIIKYVGEYENGEKVDTWLRYELVKNEEPYEWVEKEKPVTSVTITFDK